MKLKQRQRIQLADLIMLANLHDGDFNLQANGEELQVSVDAAGHRCNTMFCRTGATYFNGVLAKDRFCDLVSKWFTGRMVA